MAAFRELVVGGGNRQDVIDILVNESGMSQAQAENTMQNLESEYNQAVQHAAQAAEATASGRVVGGVLVLHRPAAGRCCGCRWRLARRAQRRDRGGYGHPLARPFGSPVRPRPSEPLPE